MDYYQLNPIEKDQIMTHLTEAAKSLTQRDIEHSKNPKDFVLKFLDNNQVCDMLIYMSRLPVFDKAFSEALKQNLDLLATAKKLKYFTNLSLGQNAILMKNLTEYVNMPIKGFEDQIDKLFEEKALANLRVKDFMKDQTFVNAKKYLENDEALETVDPHAVYPTSIYR